MSSKTKGFIGDKCALQAVLVADQFNDEFLPITNDLPFSLIPILNKPILDYSLEFLAQNGVEETFLFCCTQSDAIKAYIKKSLEDNKEWTIKMKVTVLVSESCRSFGDCLRDLDAKGLVRGDFILLEPGVIANIKLLPILKKHTETVKNDKGAVMTLIYQETGMGQIGRSQHNDVTLAINTKSRILFHKKGALNKERRIGIPLEILIDNEEVLILNNLKDTHISICSADVLPLFSDNFDFQTRDDFTRGLLMNEEIMGSTIYCHISKGTQFGGAVTNWRDYQVFSSTIPNQWIYPITAPINRNRKLKDGSIIALSAKISNSSNVIKSVIGENVVIEGNATVKNSFVFDNCQIKSGSFIDLSVIGADSIVKNNVTITSCVLGQKVIAEKKMEDVLVQSTRPELCGDGDVLSKNAFIVTPDNDDDTKSPILRLVSNIGVNDESTDYSDFSDSDDDQLSHTQTPPPDDTKLFFTEVIDSLTRGFEDGLQCDNLILEINSSRYAYNITVKEVNYNVIKAILHMYLRQSTGLRYLQQLFSYFSPILTNYIRNESAMVDCLQAIEDVVFTNEEITDKWVLFVLKWFYNKDHLSEEEILKWGKGLDKKCKLFSQIRPFLNWLEEAEEASSDD